VKFSSLSELFFKTQFVLKHCRFSTASRERCFTSILQSNPNTQTGMRSNS